MSTHRLLFQWASTIKIQHSASSSYYYWRLTCSRHDIAEKLLNWRKATVTRSLFGHHHSRIPVSQTTFSHVPSVDIETCLLSSDFAIKEYNIHVIWLFEYWIITPYKVMRITIYEIIHGSHSLHPVLTRVTLFY